MYANIDKIKEQLQGISNSADAELNSIQNDITLEIDRRLSIITDLPITDQTIREELAVFEARLVALWFKHRRAGMQERESIMKEIEHTWQEFDRFIANRFGYGVVIG
ncbi:MAG: hypothetical protein KatS3mg003_0979 [Candidatus Nitrosocaldaceae archaeon]|nr:MAG: hypothetical protein KatS3mg003_0979 [Candidatus Nitrosocaldaceae archaeon]